MVTYSAQFGSNLYGTSKATIEEQTAKGKVVVLDIEMEGVKQVKASSIDARYVFVSPPDTEELEKRLRGRGTETEESIQQRLTRAQDELAWAKNAEFDKILVNDDLEKTYQELDAFVYREKVAFPPAMRRWGTLRSLQGHDHSRDFFTVCSQRFRNTLQYKRTNLPVCRLDMSRSDVISFNYQS
ncbi:hypothetical protein Lal_00005781 [Lupinus albus]|nr:hypothetical protein Lal_00005781 [Lupinus albus]